MSGHIQQHVLTIANGAIEPIRGLEEDWIAAYDVPGTGLFYSINDESSFVWLKPGTIYQRGNAAPIFAVYVRNLTGASVEAKFLTGKGAYVDSSGAVFDTRTQAKPSTFDSAADVSILTVASGQLAAATSSRVALVVSNLAANAGPIRIGDSGVGAANGFELAAGQSVSIPTTAAVHAYNPNGTTVTVAVVEVRD
jgi:hypothetical protein